MHYRGTSALELALMTGGIKFAQVEGATQVCVVLGNGNIGWSKCVVFVKDCLFAASTFSLNTALGAPRFNKIYHCKQLPIKILKIYCHAFTFYKAQS